MGMKYKDNKLLIDGVSVNDSLKLKRVPLTMDSLIFQIVSIQSWDGAYHYITKKNRASSLGFIHIEAGTKVKINDANMRMNIFVYDKPYVGAFNSAKTISGVGITEKVINEDCYIKMRIYYSDDRTITNLSDMIGKYTFEGNHFVNNGEPKCAVLARNITSVIGKPYECDAEFFGKPTVDSLYAAYDTLMAQYPEFITMEVLGMDASNTCEIRAYTIDPHTDVYCGGTANGANSTLKIVMMPNIHGDEWEATSSDYVFIKELLEKRYTDDVMRMLWSNCKIVIVPTCNPWGLNASSGGRGNANGVNLNRNFPIDWKFYPASDTYNYAGESAADQPETQLLMKFMDDHRDAFIMTNRHSAGAYDTSKPAMKWGYASSRFKTDNDVTYAFAKEIDSWVKGKYPWITKEDTLLKTKNFFCCYLTQQHGNMDAYFNSIGIHGSLFEFGQYEKSVIGFTSMTKEIIQNIDVTITANLLRAYVANNMYILSSYEESDYQLVSEE